MSFKHDKIPFVKPPEYGASVFSYIWYVIKLIFATLGTIFGIPFAWFGFLTGILCWLLIFGITAAGILYVKVYPDLKHCREVAYDTVAKMKDTDFHKLSDTEIYDKDGILTGTINAGHYEYAAISDISMNIQNAYIDQEDRRFKTHPGFDWMAIMRAGISYLKNGKVTQGGSTITQQVIKNTYLTQEKTLTRKITEILLAPQLEKKYGKDKIMEFYCNWNFYGHHCYGVQAACRYYFGKDAKDAEPWEAALLVGISNSPAAYDPVKYPKAAKEKRNEVLKSMAECGTITEKEKTEYQAKDLDIVQEYAEGGSENYNTSYAIHCAAQELMKNDGFKFQYTFSSEAEYETYAAAYSTAYSAKSEEIRNGGYRIYTTLDPAVEETVQKYLDEDLSEFTEKQEDNGKYALQGAAVVVNNKDGSVVAVVGGRGTDDEFNRAYLAVRQPGSTIKPLLDYAPAFETGEYYPSKIIDDHQWENGPENSGGSYLGPVTIREGLNRSLNTVAWQVLQGIGREAGLSYLGKLHFQTLTFTDGEADAIAIGGFTNGTRVVDMAKGYETLANGGMHDNRTCIRSIRTDKSDDELFADDGKKEQVYSGDTAYMITDILKGTLDKEYGTGYGLDISGQQAAGKTGTTNSSKDTWFCGYTRYYTMAVWVGYDTPKAMPGIYGATYAGKIWHDAMTDLHRSLPELDWDRPSTVVLADYDPETGARANEEVSTDSNAQPGVTDFFSTNADTAKAAAQHEREQQFLIEGVKEILETFEAYQIDSVDKTYTVDKQYQDLMQQISRIEDDAVRADFSKRAAAKNEELQTIIAGMSEAIRQYESTYKSQQSRAASEAQVSAESAREAQSLQIKIDYCREKIRLIESMKYRQDDRAQQYYSDAVSVLNELTGDDSYEELASSLNSAVTLYNMLPTKAQYDAAQASKSAADASSREAAEPITPRPGGSSVPNTAITLAPTADIGPGAGR